MSGRKFNYFLAVRITDASLLENLRKVHFEFVKSDNTLKNVLVPLEEAHITLNVFHVENGRLEELKGILRTTFEESKGLIPPEQIHLQGLNSFGRTIVYAEPVSGVEFLHQVHDMFHEVLKRNNVDTDTRSYTPHLTLFNSRGQIKQHLLDQFKDVSFGVEKVSEIQMLAMSSQRSKDEDGYFYCEDTFTFSSDDN